MKKLLSIFISIVMLFTVIGSIIVANAEAEPISILTVKDQIRTVGRTEDVESGIACDWTASGIEFTAVCEENASIALTVYANAECYFTVFIDGVRQDYRVRTLNGTYTPVIASAENGLTAGTHKIKIIKQTERTVATVNIKSLVLNNVALGDKPAEPQYIFESIGDSITSGYGSLDTNNPAAKYSDGTRTYAFITAQNFGAESRVTSVSGGTINSLYSQYIKNTRDDNAFDYSAYKKPNVVTIAFGTNDGPKTVDYWQTGIQNFADAIRTGYNDYTIPIVMVQNLMTNDDSVRANIAQAVKNLESLDAEKYSSIFVTYGTSPTGQHPAQSHHKSVANKLTRDFVEFGIMPASALRSDATVTLTEKTTLEETLNSFDSVVAPGSTVTGITGELVSPLDPADAESETAKAVKYTADGTQSATTDYRYPQVRVGTVANKNDTETYRTKGISFYINYKDTTNYTDVENPTLSKPKLILSSSDKKATVTLDVEDSTTQKVELYWNTMPNISYVFSANIVYSNGVAVSLEMDGACEYTIDNVKVLLNKYTYTENANCAYTYTAGYSSYEVIGILDGYEGATTVVTTTTEANKSMKILYSWEEDTNGATFTNINSSRVNANAHDGEYAIKVYPKTAIWNQSGNYVTADTFKNYVTIAIPSGLNITGDVGFYAYASQVNGSNYEAYGVKMADGTYYFTKFASYLSNSYKMFNVTGQTLYKLDDSSSSITLGSANFADDAEDSSRVEAIVFVDAGTHDSAACSYIDEVYYESNFVGKFTGGIDGDKVVYADENRKVTTPTATISEGEFAGWVTEDDPYTIIPANTEITLTKDTTYLAVSTTRENQTAPEAPVVESKTNTSITLVANENYQYSKDGTTWQNSNVFRDLSADTEYTFYQRLKATPNKYASPASAGTIVETTAIYTFEAEKIYKSSSVVGTVKTEQGSDNGTNYTYVVHDASNVKVGDSIEYTFSGLKPGNYEIEMYARCTATRSTYSLTAYDSSNKNQDLGSVNFADWYSQNRVSGFQYYCKSTLPTNAVVSNGDSFTLKFTITNAGSIGSYIDKFVLTKVADVDLSVTTSMVSGASIRLGGINGIRFYTKVDTAKIAALRSAGYTVELGTLIAPADNIKGKELKFDLDTGKYVDVKFNSTTYYTEGEFTGIVGSLAKIKDENIAKDFVGRGYVKVTKGNDVTITYADYAKGADEVSSVANNTRSLAYVANAYKTDGNSGYGSLDQEVKDLIDNWASKLQKA